VPLAAARDYKRLGDGDVGPNTGGMGAYTPVPGFGSAELEHTAAEVFEPIAWRMARDGFPYTGVLYAGLMLTPDGPMVLEFNARFGDPEAQVLLPMLDGDLAPALLGVATGNRGLMEGSLALRPGAAVGVVIASEGYPEAPVTGRRIEGADPAATADDGDRLVFPVAPSTTRRHANGPMRASPRCDSGAGYTDRTSPRSSDGQASVHCIGQFVPVGRSRCRLSRRRVSRTPGDAARPTSGARRPHAVDKRRLNVASGAE
jgi:hypothetical protein